MSQRELEAVIGRAIVDQEFRMELFANPTAALAGYELTEAEAAFRIHKSDLKIRPVWHQKTERVQAHILVCFLAYVLWKTLGQMCKAAGLGDEPRRVFEELGKLWVVDVVLKTREGTTIHRRCVTRPTDHQAILLQRLGLNLPAQLPVTDVTVV